MFAKLKRFVRGLFGGEQCARCDSRAVGFACEVTGKLHRTHKDGTPVTVYYLGNPVPMCAACIRGNDATDTVSR